MIYTSEIRVELLKAFMDESMDAGWSPAYTLDHVRAIVCTQLGTELPTLSEEDSERLGQDVHTAEYTPDPRDVGTVEDDALRVALQVDYFGLH
jgi:hypothetical protein